VKDGSDTGAPYTEALKWSMVSRPWKDILEVVFL
jgi:deoxyhypusine synthase